MDATPLDGVTATNGTDVEMKEEPGTEAALPPPLPTQASSDDTRPPAAAASLTPGPGPIARNSPAQSAVPPSEAKPHGAPARVYLNQNVTPHLLEAMKYLAVHEPEKPLKWLSEFLAQRSSEVEGA